RSQDLAIKTEFLRTLVTSGGALKPKRRRIASQFRSELPHQAGVEPATKRLTAARRHATRGDARRYKFSLIPQKPLCSRLFYAPSSAMRRHSEARRFVVPMLSRVPSP